MTGLSRKIHRVVCAMSGGVDSAVAAFLLKRKGYEVIGLFMKNWDIADETGSCTVDGDLRDAEVVCRTLNIQLHQVNFVKEYWNNVFCEMVQNYQRGITPNPDVLCNKYIKFDAFIDYALSKLKADAIATGHYARTSVGDILPPVGTSTSVKLLKAVDSVKDQTLFLSQISQRSLQHTLFPIGHLKKDAVRYIASNIGMKMIAQKKESMGICFIGSRKFMDFIEEYVEPKSGNFVDVETGKIVGQHKGFHYWTLGQRCHLGGLRHPYFVVEKHMLMNDIIVAPGTDHAALFCARFVTDVPHWIQQAPSDLSISDTIDVDFRFQHKHPLIVCSLIKNEHNGLVVTLSQPMRAVTPGQYAVFYKHNECLGSAKILKTGTSLYAMNYCKRVVDARELS